MYNHYKLILADRDKRTFTFYDSGRGRSWATTAIIIDDPLERHDDHVQQVAVERWLSEGIPKLN